MVIGIAAPTQCGRIAILTNGHGESSGVDKKNGFARAIGLWMIRLMSKKSHGR
jgi:hypothetical protein